MKEVELKDKLSLTIPEAAAVGGIGENKLRYLVMANELPHFKVNTKTMISTKLLKEFIEKLARERRTI